MTLLSCFLQVTDRPKTRAQTRSAAGAPLVRSNELGRSQAYLHLDFAYSLLSHRQTNRRSAQATAFHFFRVHRRRRRVRRLITEQIS